MSVLNRINNVNSERKRAINEINEELKVTKKREEDATNKSINNILKLKEEVIADLEVHIFIFESKWVKTNADLPAAKERIIQLEEEENDRHVTLLNKQLHLKMERIKWRINQQWRTKKKIRRKNPIG